MTASVTHFEIHAGGGYELTRALDDVAGVRGMKETGAAGTSLEQRHDPLSRSWS